MTSGHPLQSFASPKTTSACSVYHELLRAPVTPEACETARAFLNQQLTSATLLPDTMPRQPELLAQWMERQVEEAGVAYANYLAERKAGQPRRYFTCRSHALAFLQAVAPTKLVDGAWLYGLLDKWQDYRLYPLIRTYLEELGDGDPALNHVVLYRRLLQETGCDATPALSDAHYTQGAIQLALAYLADEFLPEVLGYNLGYEQLPLHLLITAFELNELDIDPYYFTLHITVDNASTGHARKAVQAVMNAAPLHDADAYWSRVAAGMRLNELGLGSVDVIKAFDVEQRAIEMLKHKATFGQHLHSDYCTIGGRTVNEWLANSDAVPEFIALLERKGWIKRHAPPEQSRFWRLIAEPGGHMFGVFSEFEQQLLWDWIAGRGAEDTTQEQLCCSVNANTKTKAKTKAKANNHKPFKRRRKSVPLANQGQQSSIASLAPFPNRVPEHKHNHAQSDTHQQRRNADLQELIALMAPGVHETAEGLQATRLYAQQIQ